MYLMMCAAAAVLVRLGLAVLSAGSVRKAGAATVLVRAAIESAVAGFAFWAVGAPVLFGTGRFVAFDAGLFLNQSTESAEAAAGEVYGWALAMLAGAVVSAAVAERAKARVGIVAAAVLGGVVFPVVGHWAWAASGWLRQMNAIDYGGAMAVHLPAAVFALVAAGMVGSRPGRYADAGEPIPPHSLAMVAVGVGLTFVGWGPYLMGGVIAHPTDFNPVEVPGLALVMTNSMLAAVGGLGGGLGYARLRRNRRGDRPATFCGYAGLLGGLVAISAGCVSTGNAGAVLIGVFAGAAVPVAMAILDRRLHVDDPTGLIAIHGVGSVWGIVAAAAFAGNQAINRAAQARLLVAQGVGLLAVLVTVTAAAVITFGALRLLGPLRTPATPATPA